MRLEDYRSYYSAVLPIYSQIQTPTLRGAGWAALKQLANDFRYNPLVWFIAEAVKSVQDGKYVHDEVIIFGPPGSGKTSYAVSSMLYVFEDVKEVRKRIVFDADDLKRLVNDIVAGQRYDVVLIDDPSSIGLSGTWTLRSAKEKRALLDLFDAFVYVKDFIALVIFTVPRLVGVAKFFRDLANWRVQVKKDGKVIFSRKEVATSRSGTLKEVDLPILFYYIEADKLKMPDAIWKEMLEKRKTVIDNKLKKFVEKLDELEAGDEDAV